MGGPHWVYQRLPRRQRSRESCRCRENQGFLQIIGHGVTEHLQNTLFKVIAAFFALPINEKLKLSAELSPCLRGYDMVGGQKLDGLDESATPDQKEGFMIKPEKPLERFLAGPNQWPDTSLLGMADFQDAYTEYFWAVHELSKKMFRLVALGLDLDENYFDDFASDIDGSSNNLIR
ncbi:putative gibberellin 20 oxidase [Venturia nashicola]|uniref:Putative gibberellin 20 oxidase n=1 Tax=Venturia nashicola TaxID=86259 RepID=A0A4Z1PI74_9PEZI|nr:putative gibberellin 20 oxidase [Venturia nashicola]